MHDAKQRREWNQPNSDEVLRLRVVIAWLSSVRPRKLYFWWNSPSKRNCSLRRNREGQSDEPEIKRLFKLAYCLWSGKHGVRFASYGHESARVRAVKREAAGRKPRSCNDICKAKQITPELMSTLIIIGLGSKSKKDTATGEARNQIASQRYQDWAEKHAHDPRQRSRIEGGVWLCSVLGTARRTHGWDQGQAQRPGKEDHWAGKADSWMHLARLAKS